LVTPGHAALHHLLHSTTCCIHTMLPNEERQGSLRPPLHCWDTLGQEGYTWIQPIQRYTWSRDTLGPGIHLVQGYTWSLQLLWAGS
jgi:hypothetical protein